MTKVKNNVIIGLTGELACGKGAVSKYFEKKYKASCYRFSTPLRDLLNRLYKPVDRKNLNKLSTTLRSIYGEDYLIDVLINDLKDNSSKFIVLDGIRKLKEVKKLKKLKNFKLIFIDTDDKIRFNRLIKRSENKDDKKKTYKTFLKDSELETEKNIKNFKKLADYIINNDKNLKELHINIDNLIKTI